MDASALLDWVAQHQETLAWLAGGVATTAGGLWVVLRYFLDRRKGQPDPDRAPQPAGKPAGPAVTVSHGTGAGRDVRAGRDVTYTRNRIPPAAFGLAALGLLLLGYALVNSGSRITAQNSAVNTGSMENSAQRVNTPNPAPASRPNR